MRSVTGRDRAQVDERRPRFVRARQERCRMGRERSDSPRHQSWLRECVRVRPREQQPERPVLEISRCGARIRRTHLRAVTRLGWICSRRRCPSVPSDRLVGHLARFRGLPVRPAALDAALSTAFFAFDALASTDLAARPALFLSALEVRVPLRSTALAASALRPSTALAARLAALSVALAVFPAARLAAAADFLAPFSAVLPALLALFPCTESVPLPGTPVDSSPESH